jgi:hypothetical protein
MGALFHETGRLTAGRNIRLRLRLSLVQLWDNRQPVRKFAEDIVNIRYQETTSESRLRRLRVCSSDL